MKIYTLGKLNKHEEKATLEDKLLLEFETDADACAEVYAQRGFKAYKVKRLDEALKNYKIVCDKYPKSKPYGESQFNVGVILNRLGRNEEAIAELKKLLKSNVNDNDNDNDPSPNIMAMVMNYRPNAARLIASIYFNSGKYKEALEARVDAQEHYQKWNGCGNCGAQYHWEDQSFIAKCYEKMGETDKALEIYWDLIKGEGMLYSNPDVPIALTDIYVSPKKVEELKSIIMPGILMGSKPPYLISIILEYLDIVDLKEKSDVAGLYEIVRKEKRNDAWRLISYCEYYERRDSWKTIKAAEAIAALGDKVIEFIGKRLPQIDNYWALYCAGFIKDKRIIKPILDACPQEDRNENNQITPYARTLYKLKDISLPYFDELLKTDNSYKAKIDKIKEDFAYEDAQR